MEQRGKTLKSDWSFGGIFAPIGVWMNRVARRVSIVHVVGGDAKWTDDGLKINIFQNIRGTKTLYKIPVVREYDENGEMIEVTLESTYSGGPIDSGHTLAATWDYERLHQ